jgi:hypothetical protein
VGDHVGIPGVVLFLEAKSTVEMGLDYRIFGANMCRFFNVDDTVDNVVVVVVVVAYTFTTCRSGLVNDDLDVSADVDHCHNNDDASSMASFATTTTTKEPALLPTNEKHQQQRIE